MIRDLAPVHVSDVRDDTYWHSISRDQGDALRAWLRSNNLEPNDIYRIEVHLLDTLLAKVFAYARDEHGHFRRDGDRPLRREPFLAPLNSMPPGAENRGAESHTEPQTGDAASEDTRDAPKNAPRAHTASREPQQRAHLRVGTHISAHHPHN